MRSSRLWWRVGKRGSRAPRACVCHTGRFGRYRPHAAHCQGLVHIAHRGGATPHGPSFGFGFVHTPLPDRPRKHVRNKHRRGRSSLAWSTCSVSRTRTCLNCAAWPVASCQGWNPQPSTPTCPSYLQDPERKIVAVHTPHASLALTDLTIQCLATDSTRSVHTQADRHQCAVCMAGCVESHTRRQLARLIATSVATPNPSTHAGSGHKQHSASHTPQAGQCTGLIQAPGQCVVACSSVSSPSRTRTTWPPRYHWAERAVNCFGRLCGAGAWVQHKARARWGGNAHCDDSVL